MIVGENGVINFRDLKNTGVIFDEDEIFYANQNKDYFIESIAPRDEFIEEVFRKVFSTNGVGHIFFNHPEKEIYIEKNYFSDCILGLIDDREKRKF